MSFNSIRPTYSYFSGVPPVSGRARSPYAVIQLDVEIPEHIPTSFVEVYIYYQQYYETGSNEWRKIQCENIGKYRDSRTTHLFAVSIKGESVSRWFATMRLDKDSPLITCGCKDSPYCVNNYLQSVYAPAYFTIGFASLGGELLPSSTSTTYPNKLKVNIMVNGSKLGAITPSCPGGSPDLPFRCFCRLTYDEWKTYKDIEMKIMNAFIKRATLATDPDRSVHPSDDLLLFEALIPIEEKERRSVECCFFCARKGDISPNYGVKGGSDIAISGDKSVIASWDNNYGFNYSLVGGVSGINKLRLIWPRLE